MGNHDPSLLVIKWHSQSHPASIILGKTIHVLPFRKHSFPHHTQTVTLVLPLFVNGCLQAGCSVLVSLATLTGAGKIALVGLAAASNEGLGFALLFCSCPLGAVPRASALKREETQLRIPQFSYASGSHNLLEKQGCCLAIYLRLAICQKRDTKI